MDLKKVFSDKLNILIAILFIAALGLGLAIAQQSGFSLPKVNIPSINLPGSTDSAQVATNDRDFILKFEFDKATQAEKDRYFSLIDQLAVKTDTITVGKDCAVTPFIASMSVDSKLNIKNSDSVSHTLEFANKEPLTVNAGETKTITANFSKDGESKDGGIAGVSCDNAGNQSLIQTNSN